MRQGIIVAVIAALSVAALTGWTRRPSAAPPPVTPAQYTQSAYGTQPAYDPCATTAPAVYPAANYVYAPSPYGGAPSVAPVSTRTNRVVRRDYVSQRTYVRERHKRPFGHSVAIVAGSSGAGAAIGALAGGGRGAAIGALAGGAGGFLYDRFTRNR
jgi:hypothetical protein